MKQEIIQPKKINPMWPMIEEAVVMDYGQCVGIRLREADGSTSVIRIRVDQLAD